MNTKRRAHCQLWHDWKERIIRIGDEQTSLQNQFDNLRNEFTDNSPRIEALETNVNSLDGRLIIAETDIAEAEDRITACEADIDRIDAELVDKTGDINALANRMSLAEADIDALDTRVDGIDADLADKTGKINNLTNRMSLAEADIDDIDARVSGIETGDILLSQLNVDADKDMEGKTLSNVGIHANELIVNGARITPYVLPNNVLWDYQPIINGGKLDTQSSNYTIETVDDATLPFRKCVKTDVNLEYFPHTPIISVKPGSRLYGSFWCKTEASNPTNARITLAYASRDYFFAYILNVPNIVPGTDWTRYEGSTIIPPNVHYIIPRFIINYNTPGCITYFAGARVWTDADLESNLSAKIISADAVIIKDGGTVDGVDVSAHTHNGTAIGGPKISYNNLVDKPTIPTKLSQLATDDNNQRVSAAEKAEWNRISTHTHDGTTVGGPKISYNDLVNKPTIPTKLSQLDTDDNNQRVSAAEKAKWNRISTHTHDGTTAGGQKISYNNLVDKPTIPTKLSQLDTDDNNQRVSAAEKAKWDAKAGPPVPFYRDMRNVYLASGGTYSFGVDMGPIVPPGRIGCTPFTLWMQISDINGSVDLRLDYIFDDNSIGRSDPLPSTNGQHHVELKHLLPTTNDYSRKKFIKDIRIKNVQTGSCTITASLKGFVY